MYHIALAVQIASVIFCSVGTFLLYNRIDIERVMKAADAEMYLNKKKYYETNHIERRHV